MYIYTIYIQLHKYMDILVYIYVCVCVCVCVRHLLVGPPEVAQWNIPDMSFTLDTLQFDMSPLNDVAS